MKVLICDSVAPVTLDTLRQAGIEVDYRPDITADELLRDAGQ
ncbi:MAG: 3-phosphoglycerate dehydrogenase, partial [Chloroflexi bacterium]